jgi:hypothetical protein
VQSRQNQSSIFSGFSCHCTRSIYLGLFKKNRFYLGLSELCGDECGGSTGASGYGD